MYFSERVVLLSRAAVQDADGYTIWKETPYEAWADIKSVGRTEFYAAAAAGIQVTVVFVVRAEDYSGQSALQYNGKPYSIIRAYGNDKGFIELTCSDKGE